VLEAFGADSDDVVSLIYLPTQPGHLALLTDLQVLPQVQSHLKKKRKIGTGEWNGARLNYNITCRTNHHREM
jgi:hypothetical protein